MSEKLLASLARRDWLISGPLSTVVFSYVDSLRAERYTERTIGVYLRCLAHFSHWAGSAGFNLPHIDATLVERFLQHHLPTCDCPAPCKRALNDMRAALRHLLAVLPRQDAARVADDPIATELERFSDYLLKTCGLSPSTCAYRLKHVSEFLKQLRGVDTPEAEATEVERFLVERAHTWSPSSVRVVCTGLRSYFRFRTLMGDSVQAQLAAIPRVACWKQTTLPKAVSDAELDLFLEAFDRSTTTGRRDYAIARCLVDLGLRGQEVANLTLEAIDWRDGVLTIGSSKSKHVQQLPLPATTSPVSG